MKMDQSPSQTIRYVREKKVLSMFPVSRSQLWSMVKNGSFPKPVKLSARCTAWRMQDLQAHAKKLDGGLV